MRTTITIDDKLLERLKQTAAESGTTVSRLIEDAVRLSYQKQNVARAAEPFKVVTFGAGGNFTNVNLNKTALLLEQEDIDEYRRGST